MRLSFLIAIAVIALNIRQVLGMHIKLIQVKLRTKPYSHSPFIRSLVHSTRNESLDDISCCIPHKGLLTDLWFGSRKAMLVHQAHLSRAMSFCSDEQRLDSTDEQYVRSTLALTSLSRRTGRVLDLPDTSFQNAFIALQQNTVLSVESQDYFRPKVLCKNKKKNNYVSQTTILHAFLFSLYIPELATCTK